MYIKYTFYNKLNIFLWSPTNKKYIIMVGDYEILNIFNLSLLALLK